MQFPSVSIERLYCDCFYSDLAVSKLSPFNCAVINELVLAGLMWKEAEGRVRTEEGGVEDQGN